jgi:hypothetical protein
MYVLNMGTGADKDNWVWSKAAVKGDLPPARWKHTATLFGEKKEKVFTLLIGARTLLSFRYY